MNGGAAWKAFIAEVLSSVGVQKYEYADASNGVYEKRLTHKDGETVFLFNNTKETKEFVFEKKIISHGGDGCLSGNTYALSGNSMGYVVIKS